MANQTLGINLVNVAEPYDITYTGSGTLVGSDIELVISDAAGPPSKEQLLLALDQFKQYILNDTLNLKAYLP